VTMSEDLFGEVVGEPAPAGDRVESLTGDADRHLPLAVRMRPRTIEEIVGQQHLLAPGSPLRRLVAGESMSVFLWGPPGTGKTTIAYVVSQATNRRFVELSAVSAGVREVRAVLDQAKLDLRTGKQTVLFIDEVHRFSKTQQDVLLPAVENRIVTLIAATTENPSFSVISPLLSRSLLLTLRPLSDDDLSGLIDRALADERGLRTSSDGGVGSGGDDPPAPPRVVYELDPDARAMILRLSGGDARRALTYLEEAAAGAETRSAAEGADSRTITAEDVEHAVDKAAIRYDREGDQHYDVISAFIKSIRGSDVQAALHYLARMVAAGEDPRFIARRLVILASEDIGLADPTALQTAVAVAEAVAFIGMPEGRINLAHGVIALALAPKSNAVIRAVDAALADVEAGRIGLVPRHLRDGSSSTARRLGHGKGYVYAHDNPSGVAAQQYLPDELAGARYYRPSGHGAEAELAERLARIETLLSRGDDPPDLP
jgi:putative ATPase